MTGLVTRQISKNLKRVKGNVISNFISDIRDDRAQKKWLIESNFKEHFIEEKMAKTLEELNQEKKAYESLEQDQYLYLKSHQQKKNR